MSARHDVPLRPRPVPDERRRHPGARALGALLAVFVAGLLLGIVGASPASAHARLVTSSPVDGDRLAASPSTVSFTFSEPVTTGLGGITVLNADAERVDTGTTNRPSPNQVSANLDPDLPAGTYLAAYRVVSADGHIVTGAAAFGVGEVVDRTAVEGLDVGRDTATWLLSTVTGVALYGGVLMALGLGLFLTFIGEGGAGRSTLVRWVRIGTAVGALGAFGHLVARATEGTGRGVASAFESEVLGEVLRQGRTGWWLLGVLVGLAVVLVGTSLAAGSVRQALVVYGTLLTAGAFALTGHTTTAEPAWLYGVADAVHLLVAAVWLGGLVGVAVVVGKGGSESGAVVRRFSTVALVSVVVLWLTGFVQAWWTVGSLGELTSSDYGRVLGVKLVVVVATMAIAAWNRRVLVPRMEAGTTPSDEDRRRLGRTLRIEVVLLAVVVLVTSVLVETPPARSSAAGPQPFDQTLPVVDGVDLNLSVVPAVVGLNELHLFFLDETGLLVDRVESVTVEMSLPSQDIGPIVIGGALDSPGHYIARTENLVVAGVWRMEIVSRIGTFEQRRTVFDVPITP